MTKFTQVHLRDNRRAISFASITYVIQRYQWLHLTLIFKFTKSNKSPFFTKQCHFKQKSKITFRTTCIQGISRNVTLKVPSAGSYFMNLCMLRALMLARVARAAPPSRKYCEFPADKFDTIAPNDLLYDNGGLILHS